MSDVWQFWRDALAGKQQDIDANSPQCGFYKKRDGKGGKWLPVMIRFDNGGVLRCRVGDDSSADPHEIWTWVAGNPVSKEDAKAAFETGQWPDMPSDTPLSNLPDDPFEALKLEIADKIDQANSLLAGGTAEKEELGANKARNLQKQLLALIDRADCLFEAEKLPIRLKAAEVDRKFEFRKSVKSIADKLRDAFTAFMRAEERRQQAERDAKYKAEREAAERARKEVEAQRDKLMREDPIAALTSTPEPLPDLPPPPEAVKIQVGGGFGSKAGLKSDWRAQVDNYDLATRHFINHPDVRALIEKLATKAVKAAKGAVEIPGVTVIEDRKAA
jgi:hypothetical protein